MTDVLIVSEEQAVALEKAGIKVEVQYIVQLNELAKLNQTPAPAPRAPTITTRIVKYGRSTQLRWTGLKWTGTAKTQPHLAYQVLSEYFNSRSATSKALTRTAINKMLAKEFIAKGVPFNSSVVTNLCTQKYLEPINS